MTEYRIRSELSVPVNKDQLSFEERQKRIMTDIEREMEDRRRQWESEVEKTRREFFKTPTYLENHVENPSGSLRNFPSGPVQDEAQTWYEDGPNGQPIWKARFSLKDFVLDDIKVVVNPDHSLVVQAKAEKKEGGSIVSKEFSRQLQLPKDVQIEQMNSLLSSDGVLTVQAPVTSPEYIQPASVPRPVMAPPTAAFPPSRFETSSPSRQLAGSPRLMVQQQHQQVPASSTLVSASPHSLVGSNLFATPSRGLVCVNSNGEQVMQWSFNLESNTYSPDEISVRVRNNSKLCISAVHEERISGRTSRHEFTRECDLPDSVDVRTLSTFYRPEQGLLNIEAKLLPDYQTSIDQRTRGQRLPVNFE